MQKSNYTAEVAKKLAPAMRPGRKTIEREIADKTAFVYHADHAPLWAVIRFEQSEMVVVAVAGRNLKAAVPELIALAKNKRMRTIRFHTRNPERLAKGLSGVPINLIEKRGNWPFRKELVYRYVVRD